MPWIDLGEWGYEIIDIWGDGALVFQYYKVGNEWYILGADLSFWLDYWDGHFYRSRSWEVPEDA